MKPRQFSYYRSTFVAALCLLLVPATGISYDVPEDGPVGFFKEPDEPQAPWAELVAEFPDYPEDINRLLALNISTDGLPYRIYLDPTSLTTGEDRVVRFTSVLISSTGVWNINYEGLHCGERNYRRFAYGSNGKWVPMKNSPWRQISGRGVYQYRKLLYEEYLCESTAGHRGADDLVRRLRTTNSILDDD